MDKIAISRWHNSKGEQGINITVESGEENRIIYRGDMSLEGFAKCITGQAASDIKTEIE